MGGLFARASPDKSCSESLLCEMLDKMYQIVAITHLINNRNCQKKMCFATTVMYFLYTLCVKVLYLKMLSGIWLAVRTTKL